MTGRRVNKGVQEEREVTICKMVREGRKRRFIAGYVGISENNLSNAIKRLRKAGRLPQLRRLKNTLGNTLQTTAEVNR